MSQQEAGPIAQKSLSEHASRNSTAVSERRGRIAGTTAAPERPAATEAPAATQPAATGSQDNPDTLTVMTFSAFFNTGFILGLPFWSKAAGSRGTGIQRWFLSLQPQNVPDVLVLQGLFSRAGHDVVRALCSKDWKPEAKNPVECTKSSPFQAATGEVCAPRASWNPFWGGGVVVLTRRGLSIDKSSRAKCFRDYGGMDTLAYKGFFVVKLQKNSQLYVVVGTQLQASKESWAARTRSTQLKEMRRYIDTKIEDGARLVIAGDMNVFLYPYEGANARYPNISKDFEPEWGHMRAALGWQFKGQKHVEPFAGDIVPKGFWLPLDTPVERSAESTRNHYIFHDEAKTALRSQQFDWVLVPGDGDRLASPSKMRYQLVPMKDDSCFDGGQMWGKQTDDLSDHYAVFAQICYEKGGKPCVEAWPATVQGHRGARTTLPNGSPDCPQITVYATHHPCVFKWLDCECLWNLRFLLLGCFVLILGLSVTLCTVVHRVRKSAKSQQLDPDSQPDT